MSTPILVVGCGNMGFAIMQAWAQSGIVAANDIIAIDPADELLTRARQLGCRGYRSVEEIETPITPRVVLLAVKPQILPEVAVAYRQFSGSLFISIAAGIPVASLTEYLGPGSIVARCMPNTPASIGAGMTVAYFGHGVSDAQKRDVEQLMRACGAYAEIESEDQMDAVIGVSGSGPAYVFYFIDCLIKAGVSQGLNRPLAETLAIETVYGAARLASLREADVQTLRLQVTSPNGTTAAALAVLMADDSLSNLLTKTVEAARVRSQELSR